MAALLGSLGAALGTMVANLSSHKRGWDERWEEFSQWAERGQVIKDRLLDLVDEDTLAFERVMTALGMPKGTAEEKSARSAALAAANLGALQVPFQVMQASFECVRPARCDGGERQPCLGVGCGVGAICARGAIRGAWLNVKTNASGVKDKTTLDGILAEGRKLEKLAADREAAILAVVESKFG